MSKVASTLAKPYQGISQQTGEVAIEGRARVMDNMDPSPVKGVSKRKGTNRIAEISTAIPNDSKVHHYTRASGEGYFISINTPSSGDPTVSVFDNAGVTKTVSAAAGPLAYLSTSGKLSEQLELQTIGDVTFIVNKETDIDADAELSTSGAIGGAVYVQFAGYGLTYEIYINEILEATHSTPDGSVAANFDKVDTAFVATQLFNDLVNAGSHSGAWDVTKEGNTLAIIAGPPVALTGTSISSVLGTNDVVGVGTLFVGEVAVGDQINVNGEYQIVAAVADNLNLTTVENFVTTGTDITLTSVLEVNFITTIETRDGKEGSDLISLHLGIDETSKLPKTLPRHFIKDNLGSGLIIRIQGRGVSEDLSFWLEATPKNEDLTGSDINIIWKEAPKPGEKFKFDASTMPHTLTFDGASTFTLEEASWLDRQNGSLESTPFPSFLDVSNPRPILNTSLIQNRLIFTSKETVSTSVSGSFFDFFRETAQFPAATDPIDLFADTLQLNTLINSAKLDKDLIFFSENGQFLIPGTIALSASDATMSQVSSYRSQTAVNVVSAGDRIFFAFSQGEFTGIKELITDRVTGEKRAFDTTEQCPKYIVGGARLLVVDTNKNTLVVQAEDDDTLYIYNWLENREGIVQQAWHRWIFEGKVIKHVVISEDIIRVLVNREGSLYLEEIPTGDPDDTSMVFNTRLDSKTTVQAHKIGDIWEWQSTPVSGEDTDVEYIRSTGCYSEEIGAQVDFDSNDFSLSEPNWTVTSGSHTITDYVDGGEGAVHKYGDGSALGAFTVKSDAYNLDIPNGATRQFVFKQKVKLTTNPSATGLLIAVSDNVGCTIVLGGTTIIGITDSWVEKEFIVTLLATSDTNSVKFVLSGFSPPLTTINDEVNFTDVTITSPLKSTREDLGDSSPVTLLQGVPYISSFQPIMPVVKDFKNNPISSDRLTVSRFYANLQDTGFVDATVVHDSGSSFKYKYNGRNVGNKNPLGLLPLQSGPFHFGVGAKTKNATVTFSSDSHLPMTINSIEWKGKFNQRGRRI